MTDYSNIKFNLKENNSYVNFKINFDNTKTIIKPLLTTINCIKKNTNKNYDCEITEYSLKLCIKETIF